MRHNMPKFVTYGHKAIQEDRWVKWLFYANIYCLYWACALAWEKYRGLMRRFWLSVIRDAHGR